MSMAGVSRLTGSGSWILSANTVGRSVCRTLLSDVLSGYEVIRSLWKADIREAQVWTLRLK